MPQSKKNKIIHYTVGDIRSKNIYDISDDRFYTASWANTIAEKLNNHNLKYQIVPKDNVEFECWRYETQIENIFEKVVNNVKIKIFPAHKHLVYGVNPYTLFSEIQKEADRYNLVHHIHGIYDLFSFKFIQEFKNSPIIVSNHGSLPPILMSNNSNFKNIIKRKIKAAYFKKVVHNIDYFNPSGNSEREILKTLLDDEKISNNYVIGVDYERFIPHDKTEVRKKLNIDPGSFVLAYIGSLYDLKGFDIILDVFKDLKTKIKTDLLCFGAQKNDKYYEAAVNEGAIIFEKNFETIDISFLLNAADLFITMVYKNKEALNSIGMGVAAIEAMALNIPVVAFSLIHYPIQEDLKYVGIIPKNLNDIIPSILEIRNNKEKYNNVRNVSKKCLDWNHILTNQLNIYNQLISKYYNP